MEGMQKKQKRETSVCEAGWSVLKGKKQIHPWHNTIDHTEVYTCTKKNIVSKDVFPC